MFKNMLKRSWLSIIRKPGKAVLIGLILFAMANLVLASTAIKGAVSESMSYAKSTLGGTVYLQADIEKLRSQMQQNQNGGTFTPGERPQITRPDIPLSMVTSIAGSQYVKDYTYSLSAQAKASGFTPIESESNFPGGMRMFNTSSESETELEGDITISGINAYAFISGVENDTMKITDGTYFDETTDDQVIISYDLASSNSLSVGDKISLQNIHDSSSHEVTVIGIYDLTEEQSFGSPENTLYMNTETAAKFLSSTDYNNGDYTLQNVRFELDNPEQADAFIAEAEAKFPNLASDNLALSIDTSAYEQMVGPIESVGNFATTIFWIVVVASLAIITLIVMINVKDRRYEMGVLLSLGASKINVTAQILIELLIVGTIAFIVSIGTGTLVARSVSQGLLDSQIAMSEEQSENNFGRPGAAMGGSGGPQMMMRGGAFGQGSQSDVEAIDSIDVNAGPADYMLLFIVGYGVIILALALPAWNIVKYQPKTILAGKE